MGIYGQDWSSYQSATPDTSGLSFAFVKVTQGTSWTSAVWQQQRDHAAAAGLTVGLYHYPDMANSPAVEADRFLAVAQPRPGEVIVLDWEGYDAANELVPRSQQAAYKDAWLAYVQAKLPTHQVGLYCDVDYWLNVDTTSDCGDFLWIATLGLPAGQPGIQHAWLFHQYADNPMDLDYCSLASAEALKAWSLAKTQPSPPSPPAEDPVTPADAKLFVDTLFGTPVWEAGDTPQNRTFQQLLEYLDQHYGNEVQQVAALSAQVTALSAALAAVAKGALTAAEVQAAVTAALAAAGHPPVAA